MGYSPFMPHEKSGQVMATEDLEQFFSLAYEDPRPNTMVTMDDNRIPMALSYMFHVPMPKLREMRCRFTNNDVAVMQSQVNGVDMGPLRFGLIPLGTLLLLTNSPKFPYTLHVSRASWESSVAVYYDFILKNDIVVKEI